jgi:hypothetical protein
MKCCRCILIQRWRYQGILCDFTLKSCQTSCSNEASPKLVRQHDQSGQRLSMLRQREALFIYTHLAFSFCTHPVLSCQASLSSNLMSTLVDLAVLGHQFYLNQSFLAIVAVLGSNRSDRNLRSRRVLRVVYVGQPELHPVRRRGALQDENEQRQGHGDAVLPQPVISRGRGRPKRELEQVSFYNVENA